ncbi:hypothetical protein BC835DRAFT_1362028 [Cytidiella melzeri]|nr:hypothetical protein BC835DRAFT_1362028 [Cytidiella melzeri]
MALPTLPRELWLDIFRWATVSPQSLALNTTSYYPFQSDYAPLKFGWQDEEVFSTKRVLVRVCREWRCLAMSLLFEDIVLHKGGDALKHTLETAERGEGDTAAGLWRVRRICLPYSSCTPWQNELVGASEFMKACPQLEVLVRPCRHHAEDMRFDISADDCPSLASLKRLDWWHYNDAARSGGFNSLAHVLHVAPNLQYLTLTGDLWLNLLQREPITLPKLSTLRLRRMNVLFLQEVCRWSLPSLRHILLDTYPSVPGQVGGLWAKFGQQIKIVELGRSLKFYVLDLITHILSHCPELEELNYYVQFTATPHPSVESHHHVSTVRMHAYPNSIVAGGSSTFWEHVEEHILAFQKPSFPALKRIVLHGDWKPYLAGETLARLDTIVRARDCSLEFESIP